jgi:hypothetical protein
VNAAPLSPMSHVFVEVTGQEGVAARFEASGGKLPPPALSVFLLAGWISRQELIVIGYMKAEKLHAARAPRVLRPILSQKARLARATLDCSSGLRLEGESPTVNSGSTLCWTGRTCYCLGRYPQLSHAICITAHGNSSTSNAIAGKAY